MSRSIKIAFAVATIAFAGVASAADTAMPRVYEASVDIRLDGETIAKPTVQTRAGEEATVVSVSEKGLGYKLSLNFTELAADNATLAWRLALSGGDEAKPLGATIAVPLDDAAVVRSAVRTTVVLDGKSRALALEFRVRPVAVQMSGLK